MSNNPMIPGMSGPWESPTAIGYEMTKHCANPMCGIEFRTYEPHRIYHHIKCKDYAARLRRKQRDKLHETSPNPRAGQLEKDFREQHMEAAIKAIDAPLDYDQLARIAFEGIRTQKLSQERFLQLPQEVKTRVSKMLLAQERVGASTPQQVVNIPSIVQEDSASVVADWLGTSGQEQLSEPIAEQPETPADKSEDL